MVELEVWGGANQQKLKIWPNGFLMFFFFLKKVIGTIDKMFREDIRSKYFYLLRMNLQMYVKYKG